MTYTQELEKALEETRLVQIEENNLPTLDFMMALMVVREAAAKYLAELT